VKWVPIISDAYSKLIPFWSLNNLNIGKTINLNNSKDSTITKRTNNIVLPIGFNQRKYSIKRVNRK
jgi:hypothetical protein